MWTYSKATRELSATLREDECRKHMLSCVDLDAERQEFLEWLGSKVPVRELRRYIEHAELQQMQTPYYITVVSRTVE